MNKVSDFFMSINNFIKPLLNSPFHWPLSHYLALMTFTGRHSGKTFTTPVSYHCFDDTILIALSNTANRKWWRNYQQPWPMQVKLKGRWLIGTAVVIAPGSIAYKIGFEQIFNSRPFIAHIFKIKDYNKQCGLTAAQLAVMLAEGSGLVQMKFDVHIKGKVDSIASVVTIVN